MKIELLRLILNNEHLFDINKYPTDGLFCVEVTDMDLKYICTVDKANNLVMCLSVDEPQIQKQIIHEKRIDDGKFGVSEGFALNILSVALHKKKID